MSQSLVHKLLAQIIVLTLMLFCWQLLAIELADPLLPSPQSVGLRMVQESQSGELWRHLLITLQRVVVSFLLAFVLGSLLGIILGLFPRCNLWFDPVLVFLLNIPALVLIILLFVWFGLVEAAAIAAVVINKIPNVAVTLREGARAIDQRYSEMADVFQFSRWLRIRHVLLPQLSPYLLVAARAGLALIWKIVLVVELLGCSSGIGFQLHLAFQLFDVTSILAYSFAFIAVVQALEWFVLQPLEQWIFRWRNAEHTGLDATDSQVERRADAAFTTD